MIVFAVIVARLLVSVHCGECIRLDTCQYNLLLRVRLGLPDGRSARTQSLCLRCLPGHLSLWPSATTEPEETLAVARASLLPAPWRFG